MSIADFDPERYVVLDWFGLARRAYPDLDWSDKETFIQKTEELISVLSFDVSSAYLNVRITLDKFEGQRLSVNKPNKFTCYADELKWLLPGGFFIDAPVFAFSGTQFRRALITYGGKKFVEYFDGSFVCVTPEIDSRLVKAHWGEDAVVPEPVAEIEYFDDSLERV